MQIHRQHKTHNTKQKHSTEIDKDEQREAHKQITAKILLRLSSDRPLQNTRIFLISSILDKSLPDVTI